MVKIGSIFVDVEGKLKGFFERLGMECEGDSRVKGNSKGFRLSIWNKVNFDGDREGWERSKFWGKGWMKI